MNIILETIGVIVLSGDSGSFSSIRPNVGCQIGALNVHARIQNCNHRTLGAFLGFVPKGRKIDGLQTPLLAIERLGSIGLLVSRRNIFLLVRQRHRVNDIVRFGELDFFLGFQFVDGFKHRLCFLSFEGQAVEFAQVFYFNIFAVIGFDAATDVLVSGHRHELLYGIHAQFLKKGIYGIDLAGLKLRLSRCTHLYGAIGFELNQDLAFAIGVLVHTVDLNDLIFVVRALRKQRTCSGNESDR